VFAAFFARLLKRAGLIKTRAGDLVTLDVHFSGIPQWQNVSKILDVLGALERLIQVGRQLASGTERSMRWAQLWTRRSLKAFAKIVAPGSHAAADGSNQFADGTNSGCYRFAHALYREVFYRRQTPSPRAKLQLGIGARAGDALAFSP
jgi:hypothetical protein